MNLYDYKALQFKDELMNLLKKYKYDIHGNVSEDNSILIEDKSSGSIYYMKDKFSNYNIQKEILVQDKEHDYKCVDLMEEYILRSFKDDDFSFDTSKMNIGVITASEEKASKIFEEIANYNNRHIKRYINTVHHKEIIFNEGVSHVVWVRPHESSRRHKLKRAYIDKNISIEVFETIVRPVCTFCKREDIRII